MTLVHTIPICVALPPKGASLCSSSLAEDILRLGTGPHALIIGIHLCLQPQTLFSLCSFCLWAGRLELPLGSSLLIPRQSLERGLFWIKSKALHQCSCPWLGQPTATVRFTSLFLQTMSKEGKPLRYRGLPGSLSLKLPYCFGVEQNESAKL